jgi:hypothetical protein
MTITAKFPSQCAACSGKITPGEKIEWEKGQKARHASCPSAGVALNAAYQPKGETRRTNSKAAPCTFCGTMLSAGQGNLWWGEDGCCSNPLHFDDGGWHATCFDREACAARVGERKAEAKAERERKEAAAKPYMDAHRDVYAILRVAERNVEPQGWSAQAEAITLGARAAGSETIYLHPEGARLVHSSYDDYHEWSMAADDPQYPELVEALGRLRDAKGTK